MRGASKGVAARLQASLPYAVVFALAAFLYVVAGSFQYTAKPGELGPEVWPKAILGLAMAVCALQAAWQVLAPALVAPAETAAEAGEEEEKAEEAAEAPPRRLPHLLAAGIVLTLAYVAVLQLAGFFIATIAYLALFMIVGRYRRPLPVALTSVLGSLAFVFVFMKVVYVSLPLGVGPFQLVSIAVLRLLGVR